MLSRSSWSLIVLAKILPVGVTSNQLKGVFKSVSIKLRWIILEVRIINLAKKRPLKNIKRQTENDIAL